MSNIDSAGAKRAHVEGRDAVHGACEVAREKWCDPAADDNARRARGHALCHHEPCDLCRVAPRARRTLPTEVPEPRPAWAPPGDSRHSTTGLVFHPDTPAVLGLKRPLVAGGEHALEPSVYSGARRAPRSVYDVAIMHLSPSAIEGAFDCWIERLSRTMTTSTNASVEIFWRRGSSRSRT